jgi:hypothetical protein
MPEGGGGRIQLEAEQPRQMGHARARRAQALAAMLALEAARLDQVRHAAFDEGGGGRESVAAHDFHRADQLVGQAGPLGEQTEQGQVDGGARAHHGGRGHHTSPTVARKRRTDAIISSIKR